MLKLVFIRFISYTNFFIEFVMRASKTKSRCVFDIMLILYIRVLVTPQLIMSCVNLVLTNTMNQRLFI